VPAADSGEATPVPVGDAQPDPQGNFWFEPGRGGGRVDKIRLAAPDFRWRYLQAAHFGEVNVYYHLDRIAAYLDGLLRFLGASSLPRITAIVNAHHAATDLDASGLRDGARGRSRWIPFQGAHYRLRGKPTEMPEYGPIAPSGEIHFGPGWHRAEHGALVELIGGRYRMNASHNPGIIYHEYGHHLTRHTADLRGNALRPPDRQDNRKCALDEGMSDYWAATMLETPHIWAFHQRHDSECIHPRSLASPKTMSDYDRRPGADSHANGTIWAAALWDLRTRLLAAETDGARQTDLLVVGCLLALGRRSPYRGPATPRVLRWMREGFAAALEALIEADTAVNGGRHLTLMLETFARRGIHPERFPPRPASLPIPTAVRSTD
jgi:hypothetical protein